MRSRSIRFLLVFVLFVIGLAVALPARRASAGYASGRPGLGDAPATMQVFGSFSPGLGGDSRWGYGIALRWRLSSRFALGLDASRLSGGPGSIAPFGVGVQYGPRSYGAIHPWVEMGAAYVRIAEDFAGSYPQPLSTTGWVSRYTTRSESEAFGPFFGTGMEWSASDHFGLFGGVRAYTWKESSFSTAPWDGAVAFRSGLTFSF